MPEVYRRSFVQSCQHASLSPPTQKATPCGTRNCYSDIVKMRGITQLRTVLRQASRAGAPGLEAAWQELQRASIVSLARSVGRAQVRGCRAALVTS